MTVAPCSPNVLPFGVRSADLLDVPRLAALTGWHQDYVHFAARAGALGPRAAPRPDQSRPRWPSVSIRVTRARAARLLVLARLEQAGVRCLTARGRPRGERLTAAGRAALRLLGREPWPEMLACTGGKAGRWHVRGASLDQVEGVLARGALIVLVGLAACRAAAERA